MSALASAGAAPRAGLDGENGVLALKGPRQSPSLVNPARICRARFAAGTDPGHQLCGALLFRYARHMPHVIEQGLQWWACLSQDEKVRWLQCAATPEEIDADLRSPDPDVRAAAGIASVGDAYLAFKRAKSAPKP